MPFLDEGQVIPVVGSDVLVSNGAGSTIPLYRWLADNVASQLGVETESNGSLDSVVCRYLRQPDTRLDDVYSVVQGVIRDNLPPIPESLRRLARITAFKLYLSTTLDPLLEMALREPAARRKVPVHSLAYGLNTSVQDLPNELDRLDRPAIYYLLGRPSAVRGNCAVTDEDVLEFVRNLQFPERQPTHLFQALASKRVLLIGTGFPDWLMRFVLRICKGDRLWAVRDRPSFIADGRATSDAELQRFLRHCEQMLYPGAGPEAFIEDLWNRWQQRHPPGEDPQMGSRSGDTTSTPDNNIVFISYASEDRAIAERLSRELQSNGIETWFDRNDLRPGDRWRERILNGIDQAAAFLPILSRSVLVEGPREFRAEWERALDVEKRMPRATKFIFPVVVDTVSISETGIREYFAEFQAERLTWDSHDALPETVITTLRGVVRAACKSNVSMK
jgi:hypothetical protein